MSQFDKRVIEKINTFEHHPYNPSINKWFVGMKHLEELKSSLKLPDFLITESFEKIKSVFFFFFFSREIRLKIMKTIVTIKIISLNNDLKENINNNLEFADICVANYAQMFSISYR
jgi:hypothetical protein